MADLNQAMSEDTSRGWLGFAWGRAKPRAGSGRRADEGARAAWPRVMAVGSASSHPDTGASQLRNLGQVILLLCASVPSSIKRRCVSSKVVLNAMN